MNVLITGGTGSLGKTLVRKLLKRDDVSKVAVLSRDELKQHEMRQQFDDPKLRYLLGDIRDLERLRRAFHGVTHVIHAAALKQVPAAEYNPFEFVKTNVIGSQNVIEAAIDCGVERVMALSTDKASSPVNLYGATKLCADKLFVDGNNYCDGRTKMGVVRYGNVIGSRGSVIPLFKRMVADGARELPLTHGAMSRFWISLDNAANFVIDRMLGMRGGETFVPKIPSGSLLDLIRAFGCCAKMIGLRPGEKVHEEMIPEHLGNHVLDDGYFYRIVPSWYDIKERETMGHGFSYNSRDNKHWLTVKDFKRIIEETPCK